MNIHNPAKVPDDLIGPNHKLLSTEDLDKSLPEGAERWSECREKWVLSGNKYPDDDFTYRIPLSASDRLRQERDRLDELIGIVEAVEKGAILQMFHKEKGWLDAHLQDLEHFKHVPVRLKPIPPAPSSIPWTLETHPDVVCVKEKNDKEGFHYLITMWKRNTLFVEGYDWMSYAELHSDWLQRNGSPAGQEVEG